MRKGALLTLAVGLVAGTFLFTSCDNVKTDDTLALTELDVESAEDDAMVDDIYNDIDGEVDAEISGLDAEGYQVDLLKSTEEEPFVCKVVTVDHPDTTRFPKIITIDYGEGCSVVINEDTITKSGKIVVTVTDRWFIEGAMRTIEFVDFYVNGVKIEGTRTVKNLGKNEAGNLNFEIKLKDGKVKFNDTLMYTRETNRNREWVRAENHKDDVWYVTGDCEGTNLDGQKYQNLITEKLMIIRCEQFRYRWITVAGEIELSKNGESATLNFGEGTCDDTAILTKDGESKEIKVRNRYHHKRRIFAKRMGK